MTEVPDTRFVRSGDIDVAVQVCGAASPDVLLITHPALPVDTMWDDPLLARGLRVLAASVRLIACDLRGWGSSERVDGTVPAVQAWMDDIGAAMDGVGSQRATIVASAALAAPALLFAATYPERTLSVVIVDGWARYVRDDDYAFGMPDDLMDASVSWYCNSIGRGPSIDLMAPSRASDPFFRRFALRSERLSMGPGGRERWKLVNLFMRADVRGVLANVTAPCLLIHRRDDPFARLDHARYMVEHLPNGRLVEFPGADHLWSSGDVEGVFTTIADFASGTRREPVHSDRVLATILFTDIVGSTERAGSAGDRAWRVALEHYHDTAARHVEGFRGRLVKSTGDGSLAVFDGPARAIECACTLRDATAATGLPIRSGLHTGEVELMGDDVGGIAVHIGARVAALADPNEVLVSASVPPLVIGSAIRFAERGTHKLKGVADPWAVFAAIA